MTVLTLEDERNRLANRVRLLHPDHLDLDMLDEQARRLLNLGGKDEVLLLMPFLSEDPNLRATASRPNN